MTVSSTVRRAGPFSGNGVTTSFPFDFKVYKKTDLEVTRATTATGVESLLVLDSDYSVLLNADQEVDPGGSVEYAPGGLPMATGYTLTVLSNLPAVQATSIANAGNFLPKVLEDTHDYSVILIQQMLEKLGRAIVAPAGNTASMKLPAAAQRAGGAIVFDASGNLTISVNIGASMAAISSNVAAAAASAQAAGSSAGAAAASQAAAAVSEAQAAAIVLGFFLQNGASALPRTFTSKARESVSVYDYGADGTTNNTALLSSRYGTLAAAQAVYPFATALTQSIDWCAFKAAHDYIRGLGKRGDVLIPPGDFYLSETWHVTNALNIRGAGAGEFFDKSSTRLRFASDCDGIRVHSVLAETPDPGKSATKTLISDILVYCPTKNVTGSGINATATVYLERVDVYNFAEHGIRIFGSSAGGTGSCNLWSIRDCRARTNGLHGLFVSGPDTNAGVAVNMDCSNNSGWGFYDASLLGNTYMGCHANGNGIGSYKTTGTVADNVFIGCYREGAAHYGTEFVQPTHVYGGILTGEDNLPFVSITGNGTGATGKAIVNGAGVITGVHMQTRGTGYTSATATITEHGSGVGGTLGTPVMVGGKITSIPVSTGGTGYVGDKKISYLKNNGAVGGFVTGTFESRKDRSSVRGGTTRFGSGTDAHLTLLNDGESKYDLLWNEAQGTYELTFAAAKRVLIFGGNLSTQTGGRTAAIADGSYIGFPGGFWNGSTASARFRDVGLAAPTSGEWARGDARDAMNPAAAGTPGWVCTTGGTAGSTAVFKTRAVLSA